MTDNQPQSAPAPQAPPVAPTPQGTGAPKSDKSSAADKSAAPAKAPPPPDVVEASFVFLDRLKNPIEGLSVRLVVSDSGAPWAKSPAWEQGTPTKEGPIATPADVAPSESGKASNPAATAAPASGATAAPAAAGSVTDAIKAATTASQPNSIDVTTDATGYATTIRNVMRGRSIDVLVKKRSGEFEKKATVTPKKDFNAYTIVSPEYHFSATTKLTPKDELEEDLHIPVVKEGEIMTIERLVNEFAPFIGSAEKVTEEGMIKKDFPKTKKVPDPDGKPAKKGGKPPTKTIVEHHYKAIKTGKPATYTVNVLPSRLNYPSPVSFSDDQFKSIATALDCEAAVMKAFAYTESGGDAWLPNGLPKVLFERHHFYQFTAPLPDKKTKKTPKHPFAQYSDICSPSRGGYGDSIYEWQRLLKAAKLNLEAALMSASYGGFQILGENYKDMGYSSAAAFVNDFMSGTDSQIKILEQFFKKVKKAAIPHLKKKNWETITMYYNGGNWKDTNPGYPSKMSEYYEKFK
ncbi:N-acetylmuramidase family protein [Burkholderia stagnalis]|uniref:N-acetylmuramidase family protein n=1 Tax=Burkholderia stagnalis TaxID=1503054 RepID=UPI0009C135EC|nr:N-acetylmuramidase family protein [Burkholderia stagnalis]